MTDMEKAKFTAAVAGLASFYRVKLSRMDLGIYWDILREHDLKPLQEAMRCHIKDPEHGRWMAPRRPTSSATCRLAVWTLTQPGRSP